MAKYILKQEAIFALTNEANTHKNPVKRAYTRAAAIIEQITAEDVQPVRHGRWVSEKVRKPDWKGMEHDYFQPNSCSVCHTGFAVRSNFCPNCGARMDGDK